MNGSKFENETFFQHSCGYHVAWKFVKWDELSYLKTSG